MLCNRRRLFIFQTKRSPSKENRGCRANKVPKNKGAPTFRCAPAFPYLKNLMVRRRTVRHKTTKSLPNKKAPALFTPGREAHQTPYEKYLYASIAPNTPVIAPPAHIAAHLWRGDSIAHSSEMRFHVPEKTIRDR